MKLVNTFKREWKESERPCRAQTRFWLCLHVIACSLFAQAYGGLLRFIRYHESLRALLQVKRLAVHFNDSLFVDQDNFQHYFRSVSKQFKDYLQFSVCFCCFICVCVLCDSLCVAGTHFSLAEVLEEANWHRDLRHAHLIAIVRCTFREQPVTVVESDLACVRAPQRVIPLLPASVISDNALATLQRDDHETVFVLKADQELVDCMLLLESVLTLVRIPVEFQTESRPQFCETKPMHQNAVAQSNANTNTPELLSPTRIRPSLSTHTLRGKPNRPLPKPPNCVMNVLSAWKH